MSEVCFFQIFRAGTHTTMAGVPLLFTENDLSRTAYAFNHRNKKDAPLVIGHPANDRPEYGEAPRFTALIA